MSYKIKLLPVVHKDLRNAKKWHEEQREGLGKEFKLEVNKEINYIEKNPEYYRRKYKNLRQSLVDRFPYSIFYLVEETKKQIVVFGILHTSRNPELIQKRTEK